MIFKQGQGNLQKPQSPSGQLGPGGITVSDNVQGKTCACEGRVGIAASIPWITSYSHSTGVTFCSGDVKS